MYLPEYVKKAIGLLENAGFEAYAVGGCVRDSLLLKNPNDWDMTTNADVSEMRDVFKAYKEIDIGAQHGTLAVIIDGCTIEITTYRIDGEYSDNRHPDKVIFSKNLTDDLSRRDFTVNALAYNPDIGIIDRFSSEDDLKNKIIRCVGDPDKRFNEDALRILRALRFSSVLGFEIEKNTSESIIKNRELLKNISSERIYSELKKLLMGQNVFNVLIKYGVVIAVIMPEISQEIGYEQNNFHHIYNLWEHTCVAVSKSSPDISVRLCMLLHDCGKPFCRSFDENGTAHYYAHNEKSFEMAGAALKRLKADKKTSDEVLTLIKHHDSPIKPDERIIKRRLRRFGEPLMYKLIDVHEADTLALAPDFIPERIAELKEIREMVSEILSEQSCFSLKDLKINGNDILSLGFSGKETGDMLDKLLECVIDGKLCNEHTALIEFAKALKNSQ